MENYIVSARKYRPSTFDSVVGQRALTTTLRNAIATGKLAHAYLFCGPRGVGKTTCARIFAKTINCMNLTPEGEACDRCESCVAFNKQRSYNIHELDAASNNSVDDIRQLVEQVRIPPQIGKYKVYIIDEVHMLSASAFNAFLKTLEEPPKYAIFILATTEKHKILPTILSRCQIYDFNRIGIEDTVEHLSYVAAKEEVTAEPEALNVIALKADGGMRDALSIFDQIVSFTQGNITYQSVIENLNVLDYEYYFRLTNHLLENNVSEALLLFNDVLNHGFDGNHFITGLASHFRNLLVARDISTLTLLEVGASIRQRYQEQAQKCKPQFLYRAMKLCNDCDLNYRGSKNKRLLVELTLIQVAQLTIEEDDGHGPGPKQIIKPIFTPPATAQQSQVAAPVVSQPTAPATVAGPPDFIAKLANPNTGERVIPVIPHPAPAVPETPQQQAEAQERDAPFDESELNFYWREFAALLPQDNKSTAIRMQNMRVKLLDDATFEVLLDNEYVVKEFMPLQSNIESHLRKQLRNRQVKMILRVNESTEQKVPVGRVGRFQAMAEKNEALLQLNEEFGLELK
jgi:DNA polymerase-3 subunit gamma/tau